MTFYLLHNFDARNALKDLFIPRLQDLGHAVIASWLNQSDETTVATARDTKAKHAMQDFVDIAKCEYVIHFADNFADRPGRGKFIGVGFALAIGKRILVVGSSEQVHTCIFYALPNVRIFESTTTLFDYLSELPKELARETTV